MIIRVMRYEGALDGATGCNYAKALLSILSCPPHLRALNDDSWLIISRFSWAHLINESIPDKQSWAEDDPKQPTGVRPPELPIEDNSVPASPLQVILAEIVRHLCSSSFAPIIEKIRDYEVDEQAPDQANWPYYLLVKFCRYFEMYTTSASTHVDMIPALYYLLKQVELNCILDMMWFSRRIWPRLVVLMKTRLRPDYSLLLMIFKIILPYAIRVDTDDGRIENPIQLIDTKSFQGISDLASAIDQIITTRTGIECLSLEALRLDFMTPLDENTPSVFRTRTFCHGKLFSVTQAHSWVALELQADCTFYLYQLEEIMPQSQFTMDGPPVKRKRSENALEVLINKIKSAHSPTQLQFKLQTLLLIIDRWWSHLDTTHQNLVINSLLNLVPPEDSAIPFVHLCFSAIASFSSSEGQGTIRTVEVSWTKVWMRGYTALASNIPHVSRTGAHLLRSLLKWGLLESSAITQQIGQFAQAFREEEDTTSYEESYYMTEYSLPRFGQQVVSLSTFSESTCTLLSSFIDIADSDAALGRLHLEDSARKWLKSFLLKSLGPGRRSGIGGGSIKTGKNTKDADKFQRSALQTDSHVNTNDILSLLQAISGLKTRPPLTYQLYLPNHEEFVQAIIDYHSDEVLRRLILKGELPQSVNGLKPDIDSSRLRISSRIGDARTTESGRILPQQLPSSRELKTMSMLEDVYRRLESLSNASTGLSEDSIDTPSDLSGSGRFEKALVSTKLATVAISFQATLESNGVRSSVEFYRRAFTHLCSVIPWPSPDSQDKIWSTRLWAEVLYEFEPLIWSQFEQENEVNDPINRVLLQSCEGSGIRRDLARKLSINPLSSYRNALIQSNEDVLNIIWKQKAANDFLNTISESLQFLLSSILEEFSARSSGQSLNQPLDFNLGGNNINDQFGTGSRLKESDNRVVASLISLMSTHAAARGPTEDQYIDVLLNHFMSDADGEPFIFVSHAVCTSISRNHLHADPSTATNLLDIIYQKLKTWDLWRNDSMNCLVFRALEVLSPVWLSDASEALAPSVEKLIRRWAEKRVVGGGSSRSRIALAGFLSRYIRLDPAYRWWNAEQGDDEMDVDADESTTSNSDTPLQWLGDLMLAGDIRVRFVSSILFPETFQYAGKAGHDIMFLYSQRMSPRLPYQVKWFEGMLTRFIALANLMVISSPLRRGVYWHLIEVTLDNPSYTRYLVPLLDGVATRLGLSGAQDLFRAHSAQISVQIINRQADFLQLPPRVLGFRTHKDCADATSAVVLPTTVVYSKGRFRDDTRYHKGVLNDPFFKRYCRAIKKEPVEVLRGCFAPLVAASIVFDQEDSSQSPRSQSSSLREWLLEVAQECESSMEPREYIRSQADNIVASLLCYWGDIDYREDGSIMQGMRRVGKPGFDHVQATFQALNRFRRFDDFPMHAVNIPAASTETVLNSVQWFTNSFFATRGETGLGMAIVYHAIHKLFTAIHSTPLVNEQLRCVHSLSLWLSLIGMMDEPSIAHTVLVHSLALISQEDLFHSGQSIISWILKRARNAEHLFEIMDLDVIISRIAEVGMAYSRLDDAKSLELGDELMGWIEEEMKLIFDLPNIREAKQKLQTVLILWPRPLSVQISALTEHEAEKQLIEVFRRDSKPTIGRFRAVRHLNSSSHYAADTFATSHFWSIKDSITNDSSSIPEDADAFMELIYKSAGGVHAMKNDFFDHACLATRYRLDQDQSVKLLISEWLIEQASMVEAPTLAVIYQALRHLCHPLCNQNGIADHPILMFFRESSHEPVRIPVGDISELGEPRLQSLSSDYLQWIRSLTTFLCSIMAEYDIFYAQLPPIVAVHEKFAAGLLPILVHQLLIEDLASRSSNTVRSQISRYFGDVIRSKSCSSMVLQSIVGVIIHLRHFTPPMKDPLGYDKWLEVDYLDLCKISIVCGSYTTALMMLELAHEYPRHNEEVSQSVIDQETEDFLYEIYSHIDEPDGFYAIKGRDIGKHLTHKFHHEHKWEKAFQSHVSLYEGSRLDPAASGESRKHILEVVKSLHLFGFDNLAMSLSQGKAAAQDPDLLYSLAWRTQQWDLPQIQNSKFPGCSLYGVIRAVHRSRETTTTMELCQVAIQRELQLLAGISAENMVDIRRSIQSLLCLREVKEWLKEQEDRSLPLSPDMSFFIRMRSISPQFDFDAAEGIIATRISLIHSFQQGIKGNQIGDMDLPSISALTDLESHCLINLAANARSSKLPQVAFNAVLRAKQMNPKSFHVSKGFAETLWVQQEHAMAIQSLNDLILQRNDSLNRKAPSVMDIDLNHEEAQEWATLYALLGTWAFVACSSNPQDIRVLYFDPAVALLDPLDQIRRRAAKTVYYQYADFADKQLRQLEDSDEYRRKKDWVTRLQGELDDFERNYKTARSQAERDEIRRRKEKTERLLDIDKKSLNDDESSLKSFLQQAIAMYAHYMEVSNDQDQEIAIRFCGLWFAKFESEVAAESIRNALQKISTYKLLFLSHQLTARLGTGSTKDGGRRNQRYIHQLVEAMCIQHPYHSLLQVLTAKGSDRPLLSNEEPSSEDLYPERSEEAKKIVENVRNASHQQSGSKYDRPKLFLNTMEEAFEAFIQWAKFPIKKLGYKSGMMIPIPRSIALYQWTWDETTKRDRPEPLPIPVVTADLPVEMDGYYNRIPTLHYYSRQFNVAGGLNLPKITVCKDSLGRTHKQLFKGEGNDDLRQDAVMEQAFELINILLRQDRESKRRDMSLRTYKVIPLPRKTGILQFVSNTVTLAEWLPAAHTRYRPRDMTYVDAQAFLKQIPRSAKPDDKLKIFMRMKQRFSPVLRYFFTENNRLPISWYTRRLTYARSVAAGSIAGHILGLGDRHLSNILMDAKTGEVVHIDLGVAFDQGKLLAIPELVPFRLTSDIVDGLGIAGTEGVFRRCCEEALRVLREGSDTIKTVLEVFKYDPLHQWAVAPGKLRRIQDMDGDGNDLEAAKGDPSSEPQVQGADRAISSVTRKLDTSLSVEYTVNDLIVTAKDPANLSRLFAGWSPQC
ncbi:hypothetical protein CPB86DRAFT_728198 [Serendipita vermifera]|nr:hypothetical protein CPB86DRAFT_728198 [Serendipita vermifera]